MKGRFPEQVLVIGGGRWSRVVTGVLASLVPSSVRIAVCTRVLRDAVEEWAEAQGMRGRVAVVSEWPDDLADGSSAVIVVNAARDHEAAAERALQAGLPTLIEKPVALTLAGAVKLSDLADRGGVLLAAAHVFRFAEYVENFARVVASVGRAERVRIEWVDPAVEMRYGEVKRYDASVPVYADCLPHVVSIAASLSPVPTTCAGVHVAAGGAELSLVMEAGTTRYDVRLRRNGERRVRHVEVLTRAGSLLLDFASEPGVIRRTGVPDVAGDDLWHSRSSPLAQLLESFLDAAAGGPLDPRLDFSLGVAACRLFDRIALEYRPALVNWLADGLRTSSTTSTDVRYALAEILQSDGRLSDSELERRIDTIAVRFSGEDRSLWFRKLSESPDPVRLLMKLAA